MIAYFKLTFSYCNEWQAMPVGRGRATSTVIRGNLRAAGFAGKQCTRTPPLSLLRQGWWGNGHLTVSLHSF